MAGPEWWHRRVKPRYKDLLAALRPSAILDDLLTEGVISLEDYNVCHTEKTESDRSRRLLTQILPYGGEGRLDTFCEVLARSEQQNHLVELIGKRTSVHVQPYVQPVRESMQQHGAGIPQTYPSANGQPVQQPLSMQSQLESRQPPTTTTVAFQASHQSSGLASYRASAASGFGMYAQTAPSTTEHTIQYMRSAGESKVILLHALNSEIDELSCFLLFHGINTAATEPELARSSGTRQHQSVAPTVGKIVSVYTYCYCIFSKSMNGTDVMCHVL